MAVIIYIYTASQYTNTIARVDRLPSPFGMQHGSFEWYFRHGFYEYRALEIIASARDTQSKLDIIFILKLEIILSNQNS